MLLLTILYVKENEKRFCKVKILERVKLDKEYPINMKVSSIFVLILRLWLAKEMDRRPSTEHGKK